MQNRSHSSAPYYTNATLVMAFVNLLWALTVIWVAFDLSAVLITAVLLDYLITRLAQQRRRDTWD